jgi:hypothetical protein
MKFQLMMTEKKFNIKEKSKAMKYQLMMTEKKQKLKREK